MQKRRSHKKSRRGCMNCKKWHTKCDELGPPCTNCSLRHAKCEYAWSTRDKSLALAQQRGVGGGSNSEGSSEDGRSVRKSATPEIPGSLRVLELELMHQWATSTFQSFASIPEDYHYLQNVLPREALGCDYLLNGIFTASALHMSTRVQGKEARMYYNTAMELYDKASISFRAHLSRSNGSGARRDSHHLLYMFSAMTAFINITFAQCAFRPGGERGILGSVAVAFDLLNGCLSIALADFAALLDSPIPLQTFFSLGEAPADLVGADDRAALDRLAAISERYFAGPGATATATATAATNATAGTTPTENATMESTTTTTTTTTPVVPLLPNDDPSASSEATPDPTSTAPTIPLSAPPPPPALPPPPSTPPHPYAAALSFLERCFAEDARGVFRGFCCAFPSGCGGGFAAAIRCTNTTTTTTTTSPSSSSSSSSSDPPASPDPDPDPLALLILMHWAVLLDRLGGEYWWARDLGRRLVEGASGALLVGCGRKGGWEWEWERDWVESVAWAWMNLDDDFIRCPKTAASSRPPYDIAGGAGRPISCPDGDNVVRMDDHRFGRVI
ncbi:hypothetical protein F4809DRAFT_644203 [Biscogniauxia mediterranea]|nr:hypothetical protein F4809DRAFT_644203 [Biscogniauxia mediterranea]